MAIAQLGNLKKNSISTTLAAPVTAVATTLPMVELAAFSDINGDLIMEGISIGYDDAVELRTEEIKITGRSAASGAGNVTGATRGLNADGTIGVGYPWEAGTPVRVEVTTGIYNKIRDNFEALQDASTLVALSDAPVKGGVFNGGFELVPPFVAPQTASNWIDGTATGSASAGQYGWYMYRGATAVAARFDPTVSHSGGASLKLSTTDATGILYVMNTNITLTLPNLAKYLPRIKASTKYKITVWVKTNNVAAAAVYFRAFQHDSAGVSGTTSTSDTLTGTNDWAPLILTFTSDNDAEFLRFSLLNYVAGNVSDVWFDDITIDEVVEDATFTGVIPTPIRPTVVGVTTTDNIDQSLDSGAAAAQHYDLTNAVNEGATHIQQFTPTKGKITQIGLYVTTKGTGNWTMVVHDSGNVVITSKTLTNASITASAWNYWDVPCLWVSGTYHIHIYSSVADGICLAGTLHDFETGSYIQRYAKRTENVKVTLNGDTILLATDQSGILSGAILDLDRAKFIYSNKFNSVALLSDIYSASAGGASTIPVAVNGWNWINSLEALQSATDATARNIVLKVNTIVPVKSVRITPTIFNNNSATGLLEISLDGINFTTLWTLAASAAAQTQAIYTEIPKGTSTFFIRLSKDTTNQYISFSDLKIEADIDTSGVPALIMQPLGTQPQFSENVSLPEAATRVYFQKAKYLNKYGNANKFGVIVPHLEFTDTSANVIKTIPCGMDNSREAAPCVDIILAETTNGQQSGTGSNDSTTGYILNDGEYMTFSSSTAAPKITYKMGTGTTTISGITMNAWFLSSNGVSFSSTLDPSHQCNVYAGMLEHGLQKIIEGIQHRLNDVAFAAVPSSKFLPWVPVQTWAGGTPGSLATVARYKILGNICFIHYNTVSADSNACSNHTFTLPVLPKDNDTIYALAALERYGAAGATYANPLAYIDDDSGSNYVQFAGFQTATDGQAIEISVEGWYEIEANDLQ